MIFDSEVEDPSKVNISIVGLAGVAALERHARRYLTEPRW
jgi:hypothetical protein